MTPIDRDTLRRKLLRTFCVIAGGLATAALILGLLPGSETYRDTNDCFGHALGGLFSHGRRSPCESHWVYVATTPVVAHWNWLLGFLFVLLAPGVLIWRNARIAFALLWSLWAIGAGTIGFLASFDLGDWSVKTVELWPMYAFGIVIFGLLLLLIALLPIACGVFAWVTRNRPEPPPALPRATVVDRR
ncbi:MAG: hypothetical protein H0T89_13895 [Deltaproteobacteria bacterium]|nr:hypothetical protein [Deltaproteobacteria bacterium]MDQ3301077.1 hypothetical protein [Myxococcota bacterium]